MSTKFDRNEFVEVLSRICLWQKNVSMDREFLENLSSKQNAHKFGLMDQRSYRECVEQEPRNLDGSRSCQDLLRKEKEGSIERESVEDLSRSC